MRVALQRLVLVFFSILFGTGLDWIVHQMSPAFAVPDWYFPHKILYGTLIGFAAVLVVGRYTKRYRWQAFWMALIVAVLLQIRYLLLGYPPSFVYFFLGVHFVVFFLCALVLFRYLPRT
jgi:hypothetical protein